MDELCDRPRPAAAPVSSGQAQEAVGMPVAAAAAAAAEAAGQRQAAAEAAGSGVAAAAEAAGSGVAATAGTRAAGAPLSMAEEIGSATKKARVTPISEGGAATCQCSGNCKWLPHKAWQRAPVDARASKPCDRPRVDGSLLCSWCVCEHESCPRARGGPAGDRRFCNAHLVKLKASQYVNAAGVFSFGRDWSWEAKFVARIGFIADRVLPEDFVAFVEQGVALAAAKGGEPVEPAFLALMFLLQCVKWPPTVRSQMEAFAATHPGIASGDREPLVAALRGISALDLVEFLVGAARHAHGHRWEDMFRKMNAGTMFPFSGLAYNLKAIGLLEPTEPVLTRKKLKKAAPKAAAKRKARTGAQRKAKAGDASSLVPDASRVSDPAASRSPPASLDFADTTELITLGHRGRRYTLHTGGWRKDVATNIVQKLLDAATLRAPTWPSTPGEVSSFMDSVVDFAKQARSFVAVGENGSKYGFRGGTRPKAAYHVKSFTRGMLSVLAALPMEALDPTIAVTRGDASSVRRPPDASGALAAPAAAEPGGVRQAQVSLEGRGLCSRVRFTINSKFANS